uniref:Peptidyl-prolyl cis-trans isomerase n=1 Tax=Timspurckia oligopyrenoides TaxID=708627 RepID=A0A7S0ZJ10_9RHOD|mmetsp:Transcript_7075/g.12707  ORF Transcript_7075/g.12707 Transcript_7075/m.12707 type:complete len:474 (+) Transcript_7075:18-1439(+)
MSVLLRTNVGDIVIDVYPECAPLACLNFIKLCKLGYYQNCEFFNVQRGFMIQSGDPSNTGSHGDSIFSLCNDKMNSKARENGLPNDLFPAEFHHKLKHFKAGIVSMIPDQIRVQNGQPCNASQFLITTSPYPLTHLDRKCSAFGEVAEGMSIIDFINTRPVDDHKRPLAPIRIRKTIVLHDPFDDLEGFESVQIQFRQSKGYNSCSSSDESIAENAARAVDTIAGRSVRDEELQREQDALLRAQVLEMIGDIGNADLKPPENVLFVCKLNPVTKSHDLDLIFSRFGACRSEVMRDSKSGRSLGYAFIEFERKEECERAYFRMDNCLIDDRNVRVDFSQSVSKLWNQWQKRRRYGNASASVERSARISTEDKNNNTEPLSKRELKILTNQRENSDSSSASSSSSRYEKRSHRKSGRDLHSKRKVTKRRQYSDKSSSSSSSSSTAKRQKHRKSSMERQSYRHHKKSRSKHAHRKH